MFNEKSFIRWFNPAKECGWIYAEPGYAAMSRCE